MKRCIVMIALAGGLVMNVASAVAEGVRAMPGRECGPNAVVAGTVCLDTYEASVWRVPNPTTTNAFLVRKIHLGKATQADLEAGGDTVRHGRRLRAVHDERPELRR